MVAVELDERECPGNKARKAERHTASQPTARRPDAGPPTVTDHLERRTDSINWSKRKEKGRERERERERRGEILERRKRGACA